MSQVRAKGERVGEIAARAVVQLLFATGKSFTVDGLREKLRGNSSGRRFARNCAPLRFAVPQGVGFRVVTVFTQLVSRSFLRLGNAAISMACRCR
jgi:hypothetical protein